ncbi:hypothetical protein J2736_003497 [Paenibacillus qinlingensis]|uniref:Uncharacterized protein n=1 Tax=Paenibacillus qinlingensis TaxID=1837343 RepID=A0ABU1NXU1_9BACL|nr:hypothetical protein [Paenibacillus qinlingensis]
MLRISRQETYFLAKIHCVKEDFSRLQKANINLLLISSKEAGIYHAMSKILSCFHNLIIVISHFFYNSITITITDMELFAECI